MKIDASLRFFADLSQLMVHAVDVAKSRSVWGALALIPEIQAIVVDAKAALPELADLDAAEACKVAAAAYECVKAIVKVA